MDIHLRSRTQRCGDRHSSNPSHRHPAEVTAPSRTSTGSVEQRRTSCTKLASRGGATPPRPASMHHTGRERPRELGVTGNSTGNASGLKSHVRLDCDLVRKDYSMGERSTVVHHARHRPCHRRTHAVPSPRGLPDDAFGLLHWDVANVRESGRRGPPRPQWIRSWFGGIRPRPWRQGETPRGTDSTVVEACRAAGPTNHSRVHPSGPFASLTDSLPAAAQPFVAPSQRLP